MNEADNEEGRLPLDEWLIKMKEEYKQGYIRVVTAFAMLIIIIVLQALLNIDGALTALVSALAGFIAAYFVWGLRGKKQEQDKGADAEVHVGDSWRR